MNGTAFAEHVAEQPGVVARLSGAEVPALDLGRPVVLTGIGTSLHACRVAAAWFRTLSGGRVRPAAIDAHDLALTEGVTGRDQVVVVSHRGTKRYPNEVLRLAAEAGAATIAITGEGEHVPRAGTVVRTCHQERASTHSVSYTAALAVLARMTVASLGERGEPLAAALAGAGEAMARTLDLPLHAGAVDALAGAGAEPVLIAGTGLDAITAEEAALKVKEGTYRWAEGVHTEFALHGTAAVFRPSTPAYVLRPATPDGGRHDDLVGLLRAIGAAVFPCADEDPAALRLAPVHPLARPFVAILPFHRLVAEAAAAAGADPDLTHTEAEPWAGAIGAVTL